MVRRKTTETLESVIEEMDAIAHRRYDGHGVIEAAEIDAVGTGAGPR